MGRDGFFNNNGRRSGGYRRLNIHVTRPRQPYCAGLTKGAYRMPLLCNNCAAGDHELCIAHGCGCACIMRDQANPKSAVEYACMRGHAVTAVTETGEPINLAGYFCPACIGRTTGFAMLEPCVLWPREQSADIGS